MELFDEDLKTISDFDFDSISEGSLRIKIGEFEPLDGSGNPYNEIDAIVVGVYDFSTDNLEGLSMPNAETLFQVGNIDRVCYLCVTIIREIQ